MLKTPRTIHSSFTRPFHTAFTPLYSTIRLMGKKRVIEEPPSAARTDVDDSPAKKKGKTTAKSASPSPKKSSTPTKKPVSSSVDSIPYAALATRDIRVDARRLAKIMTWNVAGLRGTLKKNPTILQTLAKAHDLDFLCIQETKVSEEQIKKELPNDILPGYRAFWSSSITKKGYSGTAIFVNESTFRADGASEEAAPKKAATKKLTDFFGGGAKKAAAADPAPVSQAASTQPLKGRIVRTELDLQGTKHSGEGRTIMIELDTFFLVACYVPNSGQNLERLDYRVDEWEPDMRAYLKKLNEIKPVVYCGDLNVAHLDLDIYNFDAKHIVKQSGCTPREREAFGKMLETGFVDAFRHFHPDASGHYTYWSMRTFARNSNKGLRLDYFVCSLDLTDQSEAPRIQDCYDIPTDTLGLSDHAPAMLVLEL